MAIDNSLRIGLLALDQGMITAEQWAAAVRFWLGAPQRNLTDVLVQQGALTAEQVLALLIDFPTVSEPAGEERESVILSDFVDGSTVSGTTLERRRRVRIEYQHLTPEAEGRYRVLSEMGRGGIGRVLLARDEHIGREVAVKELLANDANIPAGSTPRRKADAGVIRFMREARITGKLEHPGIVPVYELGHREDGSVYYTMKVVRGETLAKKISEAKDLPSRLKLLPNFLDMCQAVAYAHSRGVIHRDLKPLNVMIGEFGETIVLDWGLAKVKGQEDVRAGALERELEEMRGKEEADSGMVTMVGRPIGTPAYMSPEQASGDLEEIDERSDVWSLGAMLFYLLTGQRPFQGKRASEVIRNVLESEIPDPRSIEPRAPMDLCSVALKCLSRDKQERYPSARELASDISAFLSGGLVTAFDYSVRDLAARWIRQHLAVSLTIGISLITLALLGVASYRGIVREKNAAEAQRKIAMSEREEADKKRQEAMANLSQAYMIQGRRGDERAAWGSAALYYANSLGIYDSLAARFRLNRSLTVPELKMAIAQMARVPSAIGALAMPPEGEGMLVPGNGGGIEWIDAGGQVVASLPSKSENILSLIVCPDGREVFAGTIEGWIERWSLPDGTPKEPLMGHGDFVDRLACSSNGEWLASASYDYTLRLWNRRTGTMRVLADTMSSSLAGLTFDATGRRLATVSSSGVYRQYSPEGEMLNSVPLLMSNVKVAWIAPDFSRVAMASGDGDLRLYRLPEGTTLGYLQTRDSPLLALAGSADGLLLAGGGRDMTTTLWRTDNGERLAALDGNTGWITSLAFGDNDRSLVAGSSDGVLRRWRIHHQPDLTRLTRRGETFGHFAFSSDGSMLACSDFSGNIRVLPLVEDRMAAQWNVPADGSMLMALNASGAKLARAKSMAPVEIRNTEAENTKLARTVVPIASPVALYLAAEGDRLFVGEEAGSVSIWDAESGQKILGWKAHPDRLAGMSADATGRRMATWSAAGEIKTWEIKNGRLVAEEQVEEGIEQVLLKPGGEALVLVRSGGEGAMVWHPDRSGDPSVLETGGHSLLASAVSLDGRWFALGGEDRQFRLYTWEETDPVRVQSPLNHWVTALAFHPDGELMASGGGDGMIRLWEVRSGDLVLEMNTENSPVDGMVFADSGESLTAVTRSGQAFNWPFLVEVIRGRPVELLSRVEQTTGLKVMGMELVTWDPRDTRP